jgi:predicted secreted protein
MAPIRFLAASLWTTLPTVAVLAALSITVAVRAFGLTVGGGIALFFVIWWTTLFAVLPFGISSQVESGEVSAGTEPGAPAAPGLCEKAIWTTLAAAGILVIASALMPLAGL